jgi:hypothetical protein
MHLQFLGPLLSAFRRWRQMTSERFAFRLGRARGLWDQAHRERGHYHTGESMILTVIGVAALVAPKLRERHRHIPVRYLAGSCRSIPTLLDGRVSPPDRDRHKQGRGQ